MENISGEILIGSFELSEITNLNGINMIVSLGYKKTGRKFCISYAGSKGYLSHIEISCEGDQVENNRLFFHEFNKKKVNIFFSVINGIRLSSGIDKPKIFDKQYVNQYLKKLKELEIINRKNWNEHLNKLIDKGDLPF